MSREIEKEFASAVKRNSSAIEDKLQQAKDLIQEAKYLADKSGVPFLANVDELLDYTPESFYSKYPGIDKNFVSTLCNVLPFPRPARASAWDSSYAHCADSAEWEESQCGGY